MNIISFKNRWRQRFRIKSGSILSILKLKKNFSKENNIIIFHQGRCGSTLLEKKLIQSKTHKIKSFSEIYSKSYIPMESGINNMINNLSNTTSFKHKFYEVKFGQENHLSFSKEEDLKELVKNKCKFIVIVRKDSLSQAKSIVYGGFSNKKSHYKINTKVDYKEITIKPPFLISGRFYSSLKELAYYMDEQTNLLLSFLKKLSAKFEIIYYEDIINCDDKVEKKIEKLLEIDGLVFSKNISTQKTQINYDEKLFIKP